MFALASRPRSMASLATPLGISAVVVGVGLLVATKAVIAIGLVALGLVLALAFVAPAANLTLIVLTTAVVPFSLQNRLVGGGRGAILSDLFLVAGLVRVTPGLLVHARLDRRHRRLLIPLTVFLVMVLVQFVRGLASGNDPSLAGAELRTLLGFGTFLVAAPLVADPGSRHRLTKGLLVTGLVLGLWGMAQWVLDIRFAGEFGVREGINFTTSGRGQLQGGLYAFPVATVLGFAALISRVVQQRRHVVLVATVTLLNGVCVLLTYERTFWVATAVAMGFVTFRSGRAPRARALLWGPAIVLVLLAGMATLAPKALGAAQERLVSIGQYSTDGSVHYRVVESTHVLRHIAARPVLGSGLGAEMVWSRPFDQVPARAYHYSHNGFLWVMWKLGVPTALVLFATLGVAIAWKAPPSGSALLRAMHRGSQGALLLLVIASVAFPSYNTYGITATMGILLAFGASPTDAPAGEEESSGRRDVLSAVG
jgi:hypothetical protein